MKKLGLFAAIIAALLFQASVSAQEVKWGTWNTAECFAGLEFRLGRNSLQEERGYKLFIQFRNSYRTKIAFNWVMEDGPGPMFAALKQGGGRHRVTIDAESMDGGMMYDFAADTKAFIALGRLRIIENGNAEDTTRPYEICDTDPRLSTLCMLCEYNEQPGCQNDRVLEKNARIVSRVNRIGTQGVAPRDIGSSDALNQNDIKRKIVENLNLHLRDGKSSASTVPFQQTVDQSIENGLRITKKQVGDMASATWNFSGEFAGLDPAKRTDNAGDEFLTLMGNWEFTLISKSQGNHQSTVTAKSMTFYYNFGPGDGHFLELKRLVSLLQAK